MRARNVKPGFFKNAELAELPLAARMVFAGLWCLADREGRLLDRPKQIKAEILPYDDYDVDDLLTQLEEKHFLERYADEKGKYIAISNFAAHQHPHIKEPASTIPAPGKHRAKPVRKRLIPDSPSLIADTSKDKDSAPEGGAPQIPVPRLPVEKPLQRLFVEGFKESYEALTGQPFLAKDRHYVISHRLIKAHGYEAVVGKVKVLGALCRDRSTWFTKKGFADFSIETLSNQWNAILAESLKPNGEAEAEENTRKRREANAAADNLVERYTKGAHL